MRVSTTNKLWNDDDDDATYCLASSAVERRPTSRTISFDTSISEGTGDVGFNMGYPKAFVVSFSVHMVITVNKVCCNKESLCSCREGGRRRKKRWIDLPENDTLI